MADIPLGGKRGKGRFVQVSEGRVQLLSSLQWRVKKFPTGYEQVIQSGRDGWRFPIARVIMEQMISRSLLKTEHVHHKDEDTLNNQDENLLLLTQAEHVAEHNRRTRSHQRAEKAATAARRSDPNCGTYLTSTGRFGVWYLGEYLGRFDTREEAVAVYRDALAAGPEGLPARLEAHRNRVRGVRCLPSGRWAARYCGKRLGAFENKEEAEAVYRAAAAAHRNGETF